MRNNPTDIQPTDSGGRRIGGGAPWGSFTFDLTCGADGQRLIVLTETGQPVGSGIIHFDEPEELAAERRRLKAGGCCGQPTE